MKAMSELMRPDSPTGRVIKTRLKRAVERRIWLYALRKLAITALILALALSYVVGLTIYKSDMMSPALHEGDLLLYYRLQGAYASGDVVAYTAGGHTHIGRIAALPGEVVLITGDGQLVINGYIQADMNAAYTYPVPGGCAFPLTLGPSEYFILADSRDGGIDSRTFGAIPAGDLEGKVITVLRRRSI